MTVRCSPQRGFTLVEVAIAVVILGLLLGGAMMTLGAQMDLKNNAETQRTLETARDAILGFTASQGRLPCPADANGFEAPAAPLAPNNCTTNFPTIPPQPDSGFVPAAALSLTPVDGNGHLVDAWGQPIRYAVTDANGEAFTTANGMRDAGMTALNGLKLKICEGTPCGAATGTVLANDAIVILMSSGRNMVFEAGENLDGDRFFVAQPQGSGATDDLIIWISPFTLYNRMIAAGAF